MLRRTWEYGTRKQVTVESVARTAHSAAVVCDERATNEAFILFGGPSDYMGVAKGQRREIVFCCGGPMGGYWEIVQ